MVGASLSVLFVRSPDAGEVAEALSRSGIASQIRDARIISLTVEETTIEVRLSDRALSCAVLGEAAGQARWAGAARMIEAHAGHVDLVAMGGGPRSVDRLRAVTQGAAILCGIPGALALFHEPGRALTDAVEVTKRMAKTTLPIDLWVGLRSFELADARGFFLDTIGMAVLDLPDLEAYAGDGPAADEVARWLRMVGLHLAEEELPLAGGQTLDGPDEEPWIAVEDSSTAPPQRPVLRFAPLSVHGRERR